MSLLGACTAPLGLVATATGLACMVSVQNPLHCLTGYKSRVFWKPAKNIFC